MKSFRGWVGPAMATTCVVLMATGGSADDKPAEKKPGTAKAEKGPIKVEATLKGTVEAERAAEVMIKLKAWSGPMTVEEALAHGTKVKKGDVLVRIDREKIDKALKDLEYERALAELAFKQAEEELPVLEKLTPIELADAERAKSLADEDLKYFLEVGRPQSRRSAEFSVASMEHYLEYAKEELNQLQKMYRSKDLTEETEEMILKRQRHQVEMAEFQVKNAEINRDHTLKVVLPRQEHDSRESAVRKGLDLEKARSTLPLTLNQKRRSLAKMQHETAKAAERQADLEADREAMVVRAPADGVVYYGRCVQGQWPATSGMAGKLQKGGTLSAEEVFMTVVSPRPAFVRASVEEKDLHSLRAGLAGKAVPAGYPDLSLPSRLVRVGNVPQGPGSFEARIEVELGATEADDVTPGMACSVKLVAYRKDDALTVPEGAVFADDKDDDVRVVYLSRKGEKPEKRRVKVGKSAGGRTEILDGLADGDEILTSKP
jgi:multidrug efflux pump subunit AcrA (membrane-fusion protein)